MRGTLPLGKAGKPSLFSFLPDSLLAGFDSQFRAVVVHFPLLNPYLTITFSIKTNADDFRPHSNQSSKLPL
jgi:hypothetical protein